MNNTNNNLRQRQHEQQEQQQQYILQRGFDLVAIYKNHSNTSTSTSSIGSIQKRMKNLFLRTNDTSSSSIDNNNNNVVVRPTAATTKTLTTPADVHNNTTISSKSNNIVGTHFCTSNEQGDFFVTNSNHNTISNDNSANTTAVVIEYIYELQTTIEQRMVLLDNSLITIEKLLSNILLSNLFTNLTEDCTYHHNNNNSNASSINIDSNNDNHRHSSDDVILSMTTSTMENNNILLGISALPHDTVLPGIAGVSCQTPLLPNADRCYRIGGYITLYGIGNISESQDKTMVLLQSLQFVLSTTSTTTSSSSVSLPDYIMFNNSTTTSGSSSSTITNQNHNISSSTSQYPIIINVNNTNILSYHFISTDLLSVSYGSTTFYNRSSIINETTATPPSTTSTIPSGVGTNGYQHQIQSDSDIIVWPWVILFFCIAIITMILVVLFNQRWTKITDTLSPKSSNKNNKRNRNNSTTTTGNNRHSNTKYQEVNRAATHLLLSKVPGRSPSNSNNDIDPNSSSSRSLVSGILTSITTTTMMTSPTRSATTRQRTRNEYNQNHDESESVSILNNVTANTTVSSDPRINDNSIIIIPKSNSLSSNDEHEEDEEQQQQQQEQHPYHHHTMESRTDTTDDDNEIEIQNTNSSSSNINLEGTEIYCITVVENNKSNENNSTRRNNNSANTTTRQISHGTGSLNTPSGDELQDSKQFEYYNYYNASPKPSMSFPTVTDDAMTDTLYMSSTSSIYDINPYNSNPNKYDNNDTIGNPFDTNGCNTVTIDDIVQADSITTTSRHNEQDEELQFVPLHNPRQYQQQQPQHNSVQDEDLFVSGTLHIDNSFITTTNESHGGESLLDDVRDVDNEYSNDEDYASLFEDSSSDSSNEYNFTKRGSNSNSTSLKLNTSTTTNSDNEQQQKLYNYQPLGTKSSSSSSSLSASSSSLLKKRIKRKKDTSTTEGKTTTTRGSRSGSPPPLNTSKRVDHVDCSPSSKKSIGSSTSVGTMSTTSRNRHLVTATWKNSVYPSAEI